MKKKEVYKAVYGEKDLAKYNKLINEIKENCISNPHYLGSKVYKTDYTYFDGISLSKISINYYKDCVNSSNEAVITIEKIGPDLREISEIESLLLRNGFDKRIIK